MVNWRHGSDHPQPFLHLLASANKTPGATALKSEHREFTYQELLTHVARVAAYLVDRGVQPGDVVGVTTSNDLHAVFMLALFAVRAVGCAVPAHVERLSGPELDWYLGRSPADLVARDRYIKIDEDFMAAAATVNAPLDLRPYDSPDSICRIVYSSGTTGAPIAIPVSVATLEMRAELIEQHWMPNYPFMSLIPLAGSHGVYALINAVARANTYFAPSSPAANANLLADNFVSCAIGSVAQLEALCDVLESSDRQLPDLTLVYSTGTAMPRQLVNRLQRRITAPIESLYGATEIGPVSSAGFNDHGVVQFPTPRDHVELEIVDGDGAVVPAGDVGTVRIRTSTMVSGYIGDDQGRSTPFQDGFFYPGDLGIVNEGGSFMLVGRSTEIANLGGVKIDPSLVDDVVRSIEGIEDAAFFVVKSADGTDHGYLAVVCDEATAQNALDIAQAKVYGLSLDAAYRLDAIPRTELGKVRRGVLAEKFQAEFGES